MKHKIFELATIEDVPEILEIQHQAFAPQCKALGWNDCLPLNETLDSAYEDFGNFKTFKIQNDDGKIIGSVRGHVTDGSLLIGHLVVHPDYQGQDLGKFLLREIQKCLPHNRAAIQMSYGFGYANHHSSQIEAVYPRNLVLSATMYTFAVSIINIRI